MRQVSHINKIYNCFIVATSPIYRFAIKIAHILRGLSEIRYININAIELRAFNLVVGDLNPRANK